ncbi:MAG TPA: glycosyl hydrolase family 8, partial [Acidothermaceae bacterium]|nr:glycosyl hydrolase family 8 [Acidothermaceae bacterium]
SSSASAEVSSAAHAFLTQYVTSDGRVIRHDQGGDIVSEGQSYGMLIAEIAGDTTTTQSIWSWTQHHLQRSDGLLSYHANADGSVLDTQSASDADILAAFALLRYNGPNDGELHTDGKRLAAAVLAHETSQLPDGTPVVAAGPWAVATVATVDPSYWMPGVYDQLATLTGDQQWARAADGAISLLQQVTNNGEQLPPDWAQLKSGDITAIAAPGGGSPIQYGLDAQRVPIWMATGCAAGAMKLAADWWSILSADDRAKAIALSLAGAVTNSSQNPLPMIAAAAAAHAAKDTTDADRLLGLARTQAAQTPTYYGDAWEVLGPALLTGALTTC